jgi:hypothetical protein
MPSRDVVHVTIPHCPGEQRLSVKILRLDSKHLGRMHFEGVLPFSHPDTLRKQEFDDSTMLMS